jgi:DNA-binding LacI/PurR family transcriptional regulator
MATLRSIAAAAGVHVATASSVLNGAGGNTRVSVATRKRVEEAAKRLAYVPNEMARRLRTGRSNVVGLLGGDLRNPFFAEFTTALEGELAAYKLQLVVSHVTQADPEVAARSVASLRQENVKSIVSWEETVSSTIQEKNAVEGIVSIGFTRRERPGVWLDLEYALRGAVEEMIRRGFDKLGFYFPKGQRESPSVVDRSEAFVDFCRKHSKHPPPLAFYEGESWDLLSSIKGAVPALEKYSQVQGWIGFNDVAALGLLRGLPKKESCRVLCFDGTILARCWPGSPTYLDLKIPEFARAVAAVVAGKLDATKLGERQNWFKPSVAA